jgi:hypothetical protein
LYPQRDASAGNEFDITIEQSGLDPDKAVTLDGVIWQETEDGTLTLHFILSLHTLH